MTSLKQLAPGLDSDLFHYSMGYIQDPICDHTAHGLFKFLAPLLVDYLDESIVETFCSDLASSLGQIEETVGVRVLGESLIMNNNASTSAHFQSLKAGDIRHSGRSMATAVDQRKLRQAEKKIAAKRQDRAEKGELIVDWDPNYKPPIIVNQMKTTQILDSRSKDVKLENFDINYAGKKILTNCDLMLAFGRRYGLVGKNGVGKSTLLRAIAQKELLVSSHLRVLHVEQEIAGDDTPALVSVLQADTIREGLLEQEKSLNSQLNKLSTTPEESSILSAKLKDIYQKLEDIESHKAEARAAAILNGLGFSRDQQGAATRTFSGGWRMRLALARALFCRPDLLLADEVTNYLDFPAVVWLEKYFQNWPGTLLVVSHDKSFLNAVVTDILHMNNGQLSHFKGSFTNFVGTRAEKRRNQIREYEAQLQYRQHLQDFIDRWRYNAKRAPQAQSKMKILEKLPPLEPPAKDEMEGMGEGGESVYFRFPDAENLAPPILQLSEVKFGYKMQKGDGTVGTDKEGAVGRIILENVSLDVQMDSKIAIVGPNGAGKSTMVHLLTGEYPPIKGMCHRHGRLRLALFSQHHVDQLDLALSSVAFLANKFPGSTEEEYRRVLGRFGLSGTTPLQPIGTLSGGQKSRVVWLAMMNPHVLVLDEPTNHLDMDSIDALSAALKEFKGGIVIVSHDEEFLDSVCNEVWVCCDGKLTKFEGRDGDSDGVVKQYKNSLLKDE